MFGLRAARIAGLGFVLALVAQRAPAWDLFGHHVVGAIAWEQMDESTRRAVVELLLEAPSDSDIPHLLPPGWRPFDARARELFIKTQGWADLVRDEIWSSRNERYDHPTWHYVNHFWMPAASGPRRLEEKGTAGELIGRLEASKLAAVDSSLSPGERAIAVAWILHLAGDVHQPLHSSGRVTADDPDGDRGGNNFALDDEESPNLHALWDSILRRSRRQSHSESYFAWVSRVSKELSALHPPSSLEGEISKGSVEEWSREGASIAMAVAYPDYLTRGAAPPKRYRDEVFEEGARRAALAGYRLARLLNGLF